MTDRRLPVGFSLLAGLLLAGAAQPATLADFEAKLASNDSATQALTEWCKMRHLAEPSVIHAEHIRKVAANDPPAKMRRLLDIGHGEPLVMRRVHLACGDKTLSIAWNWFVPARLTPSMREALETSNVPFGKVAAPLGYRREPLETLAGAGENCPRGTISTHRALLRLPDSRPLAYVIECYTAANIAP